MSLSEFDIAIIPAECNFAKNGPFSIELSVKLRHTAKEIGRTTQFSAIEACDCLVLLSNNKVTAEQAIGVLPWLAEGAALNNFNLDYLAWRIYAILDIK